MSDGEFTCEASALAKALRDIVSIVPGKEIMAILANVLIEAKGKSLRVTATDMDKTASRVIPADVKKAGETTVEANRFASVISALPSGSQASFKMAGEFLSLTAGRGKFRFSALSASNFPPMPFGEPVASFEAGADFIRALETVRHAVQTDQTQFVLCGAYLHLIDGNLALATIDGKRSAQVILGASDAENISAIIPTGVVDLILKLADDRAINVDLLEGKARFTFGDTILTAKMVEGGFPDYQRTYPKAPGIFAKINGPDAAAALTRIALMTDDKDRKTVFVFSRNKVTISNIGRDEGVEELPCDYAGDDFRIGFNSRFMRDTIAALGAQEIAIGMTTEEGPAIFTTPTRDDVKMILMPMKC